MITSHYIIEDVIANDSIKYLHVFHVDKLPH